MIIFKYKYLQRDGGYNKSEIINHLMEILITGENSYEKLALKLLSGDKSISRYFFFLLFA